MTRTNPAVSFRYAVKPAPEAWVLPEEPVPEAIPHSEAARELEQVLLVWARRTTRSVAVARNLAVRWLQHAPQSGIDPDVCVLEPPPPNFSRLSSLRLWEPGHVAPPLCIEIVSQNHPYKDYAGVQDRYAAFGAFELVVFDPLLAGPRLFGGPVLLQLWRRDETGLFERVHFENTPAFSKVLGAWFIPEGRTLRIADDPEGKSPWLSGEESERAEKDAAIAQSERERAEKDAAIAQSERERAEKEQERAEKERERAARVELEQRVLELERRLK